MKGCPICGASSPRVTRRLYDDRYGFTGTFELQTCHACGHRRLDWEPDEQTLGDLYSNYYPRSARAVEDLRPLRQSAPLLSWWRGQRSSASFWVPENVCVLDIGCGFGESLAYHRLRGCDAQGVEVDRNIARVAETFGFTVQVGLFDHRAYAPGSFDYVTMDQVLEHLVDPIATLRGIQTVLRPGGRLVLSTPNASSVAATLFGNRWINWHAPYHLQFFSRESLRAAARRAGLQVDSITTITSSEWLKYQWIHLLTAPAEGTASSFWSGRRGSLAEQAWATSARVLHRTGLDHLITRVFDAVSAGDNFVAQLARGE